MTDEKKVSIRKTDVMMWGQVVLYIVGAVYTYFVLVSKIDAHDRWIEKTEREEGKTFIQKNVNLIREEVDRAIKPLQNQLDRIESKLDRRP